MASLYAIRAELHPANHEHGDPWWDITEGGRWRDCADTVQEVVEIVCAIMAMRDSGHTYVSPRSAANAPGHCQSAEYQANLAATIDAYSNEKYDFVSVHG